MKYLLFALLTFNLQADDEADKCALRNVLDNLYVVNKGLLKDAKENPDTTFFFWGRFRQSFESVPPETIDRLFNTSKGGLTVSDIDRLWFASHSGHLKTTREEEDFLDMLKHFSSEESGRRAFAQTENLPYHILEALKEADKRHLSMMDVKDGAELTEQGVINITDRSVARALAETLHGKRYKNGPRFVKIARWVFPIHDKIVKLIHFNQNNIKELQLAKAADAPFVEALAKYKDKLDPKATSDFQKLVADTGEVVASVRKQNEEVYGKEVSLYHSIPDDELTINKYAKKINSEQSENEIEAVIRKSEKDFDVLDEGLERSFGKKPPLSESHPVRLQVRYSQYRRETPVYTDHYYSATNGTRPTNSSYRVDYQWTEHYTYSKRVKTGTRKNAQGVEEDVYEIKHDYDSKTFTENETVHIDTEEVLQGQAKSHLSKTSPLPPKKCPSRAGWSCSSTQGDKELTSYDSNKVDQIMDSGKNARAQERPFRSSINEANAFTDSISPEAHAALLKDNKAMEQTIKDLTTLEQKLEGELKDFREYAKSADKAKWPNDTAENFKMRNGRMLARYDLEIKRIQHVREQLNRRQDHLEFQYELKDYSPEIEILAKQKKRARTQQAVIAGTVTASGGGYAYYKDEVDEEVKTDWQRVKLFMGLEGLPEAPLDWTNRTTP